MACGGEYVVITAQGTPLRLHPLHFRSCSTGKRTLRHRTEKRDACIWLCKWWVHVQVSQESLRMCFQSKESSQTHPHSSVLITCVIFSYQQELGPSQGLSLCSREGKHPLSHQQFNFFFFPTVVLLPYQSLRIFHGDVQRLDHFQMLRTGDAEFPHNVDFASYRERLNHLQHSCLEEIVQFNLCWNASTISSAFYFCCCNFLPRLQFGWLNRLISLQITSSYQHPRLSPFLGDEYLFFLPLQQYSLLSSSSDSQFGAERLRILASL